MAKFCESCGRGPLTAISRSKSMIATRRRQKINLQNKTIEGKKMRVCTKCLKGLTKGKITITGTVKKKVGVRTKKGK